MSLKKCAGENLGLVSVGDRFRVHFREWLWLLGSAGGRYTYCKWWGYDLDQGGGVGRMMGYAGEF